MSTDLDRPRKTAEEYFYELEKEIHEKNSLLSKKQESLDLNSKEFMKNCINSGKVSIVETSKMTAQMNAEFIKLISEAKSDTEKNILLIFYALFGFCITLVPVILGVYGAILSVLFGKINSNINNTKKEEIEKDKQYNLLILEEEKKNIIDKRTKLRGENTIKVQEYISLLEDKNEIELNRYKLLVDLSKLDEVDYSIIERHLKDEINFVASFFIKTEKESILFVSDFDEYFLLSQKIIENLINYRQNTLIKHFLKINEKFSMVEDFEESKHIFLLEKSQVEDRYNKLCIGDILHIITLKGEVLYKSKNYYYEIYCNYRNITPEEETNTSESIPLDDDSDDEMMD